MSDTGRKILIVDDNAPIRRVTRAALERVGYEVLDAEDGESGVELFMREQAAIGLVLLDLTMPGIDGEETFRQLREIQPGVQVVMMSGYDEPAATAATEGLGFLQKPFLPTELREKVAEVIPLPPKPGD